MEGRLRAWTGCAEGARTPTCSWLLLPSDWEEGLGVGATGRGKPCQQAVRLWYSCEATPAWGRALQSTSLLLWWRKGGQPQPPQPPAPQWGLAPKQSLLPWLFVEAPSVLGCACPLPFLCGEQPCPLTRPCRHWALELGSGGGVAALDLKGMSPYWTPEGCVGDSLAPCTRPGVK